MITILCGCFSTETKRIDILNTWKINGKNNFMDNKQTNALLGKLRRPIHIDYIARYILKESVTETKKVLDKLMEEGVIEESKYAKDYYVVKNV